MSSLCSKASMAPDLTCSTVLSLSWGARFYTTRSSLPTALPSHLALQSCGRRFSATPSTLSSQGLGVCSSSAENVLRPRYLHGLSPYSFLASAPLAERLSLTTLKKNPPGITTHLQFSSQQLHGPYLFVSCHWNERAIILLCSLPVPATENSVAGAQQGCAESPKSSSFHFSMEPIWS